MRCVPCEGWAGSCIVHSLNTLLLYLLATVDCACCTLNAAALLWLSTAATAPLSCCIHETRAAQTPSSTHSCSGTRYC